MDISIEMPSVIPSEDADGAWRTAHGGAAA